MTPQVIKTFKEVYINVISREEELIEKTKSLIAGDIAIKTNYCDEDKSNEWAKDEKIQKRFRYQRRKIGL